MMYAFQGQLRDLPGLSHIVGWREGFGWFEGFATGEEIYRIKSPLSLDWLVIKGMAIGAVVGSQ